MSHHDKMILRHPLAIRFWHWWNVVAMFALGLSGFYIHAPLTFKLFSTMDTARTIHFVAMWMLAWGIVYRVFYAIYTKDYKNVVFRLRDFKDFWSLTLYYLFIKNTHPDYGKYNPGQKLMYTFIPIFAIVQGITGFIMYWPNTFNGLAYALGGFIVIRMIHYCVTWIFVLMFLVHFYLDMAEGLPVLWSMIHGKIPADFHADIKTPRPEPKKAAEA